MALCPAPSHLPPQERPTSGTKRLSEAEMAVLGSRNAAASALRGQDPCAWDSFPSPGSPQALLWQRGHRAPSSDSVPAGSRGAPPEHRPGSGGGSIPSSSAPAWVQSPGPSERVSTLCLARGGHSGSCSQRTGCSRAPRGGGARIPAVRTTASPSSPPSGPAGHAEEAAGSVGVDDSSWNPAWGGI